MRTIAIAFVGFLALAMPVREADAQLCHLGPLDQGDDSSQRDPHAQHHDKTHHVEVMVSTVAATHDAGSFQGVGTSVAWHRGRYGAYAALFGYRVVHPFHEPTFGVGDAVVQGHVRVVGDSRWRAGVVVALGIPTGRSDDGLGMGHAMAMPGLWGLVRAGRATTLATAVIGKSIGDRGHGAHADHHAHHMHELSVNPMNPFEVGGTLRTAVTVSRHVDVHAIGLVAQPIGEGVLRAATGGGVSLRLHRWNLSGETQVGIAGDPFDVRSIVEVSRSF